MLPQILARAFLAVEMDAESAAERGQIALGQRTRWVAGLARRFVVHFQEGTRPRLRAAVAFIRDDDGFREAVGKKHYEIARWLTVPAIMQPVPAAQAWGLPAIVSAGELADWLCLGVTELECLADLRGTASPGHYHYQSVAKQSGAVRVLEAPKVRLKAAQRRIPREMLDLVPGHGAAHGFRAGRSIRVSWNRTSASRLWCGWTFGTSFLRSAGRGFRPYIGHWVFWRLSPMHWVDCVRTRLR